jgi:hypothetical protein
MGTNSAQIKFLSYNPEFWAERKAKVAEAKASA